MLVRRSTGLRASALVAGLAVLATVAAHADATEAADQTVTIAVTPPPLTISLAASPAAAIELTPSTASLEAPVGQSGTPATLTFQNPNGTGLQFAQIVVQRRLGGDALDAGSSDLTLTLTIEASAGHVPAFLVPTWSGPVATEEGTLTEPEKRLTEFITQSPVERTATVTWSVSGTPGDTSTLSLANTFRYTIEEYDED